MARNNSPFVGKKTVHRKNKKGERVKAGVTLVREDNTEVTLLNPSAKAAKYAKELKTGERFTNSGEQKKDDNGNVMKLTKKEQRAYRSGYLDAQKDNAKVYNAKNK